MRRTGPAWLLGFPLAVLGWLSAHAVAYELVAPGAHERAHLLASSGHGYLEHAPLLAAACVVLVAGGFFLRARGRRIRLIPPWALGVLPLVGFAVQEYLERALQSGVIPWGTALEPVFLVGFALQLPFAVVAAFVARALTGLADSVAARESPRPRFAPGPTLPRPTAAEPRPSPALASGHAGRAPPLQA
jgi:hypothetical protein